MQEDVDMSGIRSLVCAIAAMALCLMSVSTLEAADPAVIPPGAKITIKNWQQYKAFMPDGMIALFEGNSGWKMPSAR